MYCQYVVLDFEFFGFVFNFEFFLVQILNFFGEKKNLEYFFFCFKKNLLLHFAAFLKRSKNCTYSRVLNAAQSGSIAAFFTKPSY